MTLKITVSGIFIFYISPLREFREEKLKNI